jgi:hypothetical protein
VVHTILMSSDTVIYLAYGCLHTVRKMSYPQLLHSRKPTEDFVVFTVPNDSVVKKITRDGEQDTDLRINAAAKSLSSSISELAFLLSTYNAKVLETHGKNELKIRLGTKSLAISDSRRGRVILERQPEIRDPGLQDSRTAMWRLETIDEEEEELGEEVEAFYMI